MAKRIENGGNKQMDLFGGAAEPTPSRRQRRRDAATPIAELPPQAPPSPVSADPVNPATRSEPPVTLASLADRASHPDIADFLAALGDEQLAYLAVAAARELRRRLKQPKQRSATSSVPTASPQALRRAIRLLADELSGTAG